MKYVYQVWCEWDIGQHYIAFSGIEEAQEWATQALENCAVEESYAELYEEGLIGTTCLKVIA